MWYRKVLLSILIHVCAVLAVPSSLLAAAIDKAAFDYLNGEADKAGVAPVVVNLASLSLVELADKTQPARMNALAQRLMAELGGEVWPEGRWENSIGQMGFFVTSRGLSILRETPNAVAFWPGQSMVLEQQRSRPAFRAAEAALQQTGTAVVAVTLRNNALDYTIERDGSVSFQPDTRALDEQMESSRRLAQYFRSRISLERNQAMTALGSLPNSVATTPGASFSVRVDRKTFHALTHNAEVASLALAGFTDLRPQVLDTDVIEAAKRDGVADVILSLRSPMPLSGLSAVGRDKMKAANTRAFTSLLAEHGISGVAYRNFAEYGVISVRLTPQQIQRLYQSADKRLLAVSLNKPMGTIALATSTLQMNLPTYWNSDAVAYPEISYPDAGFRGAYPSVKDNPASAHVPINIVVFDTGVQRTHPMLAGRISFEACFGSNVDLNVVGGRIVRYRSICQDQSLEGDSPLSNLPGYGNPSPLGINCVLNTLAEPNGSDACSHGTHVAGIAAGNNGAGRRGVAPSARVISVQTFSYDIDRIQGPQFFAVDLLAGLQATANAMNQDSNNNDFVVNMSLGTTQLYGAACTSGSAPGLPVPVHPTIDAFVTAVGQLSERGVPVIAATGNNFGRNAIAFPACIPGVIKVLAAANDMAGSNLARYSNLPNVATIGNELVFLAPGGLGRGELPVVSAWIDPARQYDGIAGTSMAAPHVAGLYAVVKAAFKKLDVKKADGTPHDLSDVAAWINASGSTPLTFNVAAPGQPADFRTYRRVRLP